MAADRMTEDKCRRRELDLDDLDILTMAKLDVEDYLEQKRRP